jgi:hypothetical protein
LHYMARMPVEAWWCAHLVMTVVLGFVLTMAYLRCTTKNQACGIGQNLDYDGVSSFSIAIIALRHHYFVLSCQPTSPEAL